MKVEMAVLGSPSLISLMVSVDVQHHERRIGRYGVRWVQDLLAEG